MPKRKRFAGSIVGFIAGLLLSMPAGTIASPLPLAPGDLAWSVSFGAGVPLTHAGFDAVAAHGGFVAAVGEKSTYGPVSDPFEGRPLLERDGLVFGIDASNGDELWSRMFPGAPNTWQTLDAVALSPDGSWVFVTGSESPKDEFDRNVLILCFDTATGDLLWERRYGDGTKDRWGSFIEVTPDGGTVVVGGGAWENSHPPVIGPVGGRFVTLALDAATGVVEWHREWQHRFGLDRVDEARGMALSPDGSQVVVTGMSNRKARGIDYATIAYAVEDGTRSWIAWFDGPATGLDDQDTPEDVVYDPDGSQVVVTGYSWNNRNGYMFATLAYRASDGHRRWLVRYEGPARGLTSDIPTGAAFAPNGTQVYVTGDDQRSVSTVAYGAGSGSERWVRVRSHAAGKVHPSDGLAVDSDDGTVLMGGRLGPKAHPFAAMALDPADGARLWASGPPSDDTRLRHFTASGDQLLIVGRVVNGNASIPAIASYDSSS
ncbi:MAG: PQQ-binding-like beta-propeller repeat protein [Actinomycetota bacterium]